MNEALRLDPCIGLLLAIAYAAFFGWSAQLKLRDVRAFSAVVARYQLLPQSFAPSAAYLLALCEAAIALSLLLPQSRAPAAVAGCGLCLLYAAAIGINLGRGRRELDCGCSGPLHRRPIAPWMVWRNLGLAAVLPAICLPWSSRTLTGVDLLSVAGGAVAVALIYAAWDSLMTIPAAS